MQKSFLTPPEKVEGILPCEFSVVLILHFVCSVSQKLILIGYVIVL